jgi:NAD(P)-dependent dehydrogenase (short-subunit alcohol dehydrogenase family)
MDTSRTTLITGAASGIGAATAMRVAAWSSIAVADRDLQGAEKIAARIVSAGGKAMAVEVDVQDRTSVASMVECVTRELGAIQGLFNNAGINIRQGIDSVTARDWDAVITTHVKGTLLVSQAVLPQMLARGSGAVVNSGSDFSVIGVPGLAAYCAAKTAVFSMTKAMAVEFTSRGIRINAVGPGPIDTPMLRSGTEEEVRTRLEDYRERIPMKRLGRPEEVAAVVDFLLSERASYIAGQIVHPNGGTVMW